MPSIIQNLFRDHFDAYAAAHGASGDQYRAANAIIACRTPALGGHVQGCPLGHEERLILHSCRHRSCPQCQGIERARWLEDTSERLLECTHHHLIFTIPHSLNALWMHNRRVLAEALFGAAHEALSELLDDPRYLGARPGVLLALHTWGRNLALHPHIHALVSDGGFDGEIWCPARRRHFLPARVLMALFRGKFLARHQAGIDAGEIVLPAALSPDDARRLLGRCARQRWNVHLRTGYAHGEGVVRYLARYVRGGATQSSQIVAVTAQQITLRYHAHDSDGEEASWRLLHLTPDAFIQRTLQHVPPARAHQVRRYGLYAAKSKGPGSISI